MKKVFLLLSLILTMPTLSFSQDTTATTIQETERLVDKYSSKAVEVVSQLAESLSVPAEHVYKVLVTQSYVDATTYLLYIIFGILLSIPFYRFTLRDIDWDDLTSEDNRSVGGELTIVSVIGCIGIILFLIGICNIPEITQGFLNPEYKAIRDIAELIGLSSK